MCTYANIVSLLDPLQMRVRTTKLVSYPVLKIYRNAFLTLYTQNLFHKMPRNVAEADKLSCICPSQSQMLCIHVCSQPPCVCKCKCLCINVHVYSPISPKVQQTVQFTPLVLEHTL